MAVYLDSSAIVKLVVRERESPALRRFLRTRPERVSCGLARTEVLRAVRHLGPSVVNRARRVLRRVDLIRLDDSLLDAAGVLDPLSLRSLDAVHLASALLIAPELDAVVTYDRRQAEGARLLGLHVEAPAGR
jgi:predicted nucleic acid-binding protein